MDSVGRISATSQHLPVNHLVRDQKYDEVGRCSGRQVSILHYPGTYPPRQDTQDAADVLRRAKSIFTVESRG